MGDGGGDGCLGFGGEVVDRFDFFGNGCGCFDDIFLSVVL